MRFAVFDHNDASGRATALQLAERLSLIQAYERFGYYAYQMAEHHGTPLGVGRGISPIETGFHGVPGEEAQGRFDEAFEILRMGLTSDVVDFHGKYYQVDSAPIVTHPIQQPMPLWYATMTVDRARWCARLAMPMLALVPSPRVRTLTDAYKAEWAALGRDEADLPPLGISRQGDMTAAEALRSAELFATEVMPAFT